MPVLVLNNTLPVVLCPGTAYEIDLNDGFGYLVRADPNLDPPAAKPVYASSQDTEGAIPVDDSVKYENREIAFTVRVYGSDEQDMDNLLAAIYRTLGRVHRKGGEFTFTFASGRTCTFDLVPEATAAPAFSERSLSHFRTDVDIRLQARPFWRGQEVQVGAAIQTANAPLEITTDEVEGDVPALGRLLLSDLSGFNQWEVMVGNEATYYNAATNAKLFYVASDMTPLGTSSASPGFGWITSSDLTTSYKAILSSRLVANGDHLGHVGGFRVRCGLLRPTLNNGQVSVRLQYRFGDGPWTLNPAVTYPTDDREGVGTVADLGTLNIPNWVDHWEFQLLAKTTVLGDDLTVAYFSLFPTTDGFIRMSTKLQFETPTEYAAYDNYDQTAGALTGKTLPSGGTWSAVGDAGPDWNVDGVIHYITRTSNGDDYPILGRTMLAGATTYTNVAVTSFFGWVNTSALPPFSTPYNRPYFHLATRFVDEDNFLALVVDATRGYLNLLRVTLNDPATMSSLILAEKRTPELQAPVGHVGMRLEVLSTGVALGWVWPAGGIPPTTPTIVAQHADLATGGALASGRVGFGDRVNSSVNFQRSSDSFSVFVPTVDAAMFAGRSLELGSSHARREDATGSFWSPVAEPAGRYLRLQPGTNRLLVRALRNDPVTMPNDTFSDCAAVVYATPRGLAVPGP